MTSIDLAHGDCIEWLTAHAAQIAAGEAEPFDSCVTDPPYHLTSIVRRFGGAKAAEAKDRDGLYQRASRGFMGKTWDGGDIAQRVETWRAVYDCLKPGAHLVAFAGTRTYHRMVVAIEDAGFEIRDSILDLFDADALAAEFMASLTGDQAEIFARLIDAGQFTGLLAWIYGTGFPKSHDVSKGIDKHNGDKRPVVGRERLSNDIRGGGLLDVAHGEVRPAFERDITVAASAASAAWQGWGTALKPALEPIVLARKPLSEGSVAANVLKHGTGALNIDGCRIGEDERHNPSAGNNQIYGQFEGAEKIGRATVGRWPANIVTDGSDAVAAMFPDAPGAQGIVTGNEPSSPFANVYGDMPNRAGGAVPRGDAGSASRFFYSAKAGPLDRIGTAHATVKPVDLMRWLVRLITPPGGKVLEPFAGSGTTGIACMAEGFGCQMIELEADHVADITRKLAYLRGEGGHSTIELHKAKRDRAAEKDAEPIGGLFGDAA